MKISGLITAMLIVSLIVIGVYTFVEDLSGEQAFNTPNVSTSYRNTYDKIDELQRNLNNTQQELLNVNPKEDKGFFTGTWDVFVITKDVVVGAVGVTGSSIGIGSSLLTDFSNDLGMDNSIYSIILTLLTLGIVGALIFLIIKRKW